MAKKINLSERQLSRRLKISTDFSTKEYLKIERFERALKSLPSFQVGKLSELAYELGYYDQAHFNHEFKEMLGSTPIEYLKMLKEKVFHLDEKKMEYSLLLSRMDNNV